MNEALPLTGERTVPGVPAENYWFRRHEAAYRFAARVAGGTVVDAGCGEGYGAELLARRARRVIALDLDEPTLAHAAHRYLSPRFVRCDLLRAPLSASSVDSIVALQVIEHFADADALVRGFALALRPGGVLVLSTPNRITFPAGINPLHAHEYDAAELAAVLGRHFSDVRLLGLAHRARLGRIERLLGEPIQERLVRTQYAELPGGLRAALRTVRAGSFRVTPDPNAALDLLAVCRNAPHGAQP